MSRNRKLDQRLSPIKTDPCELPGSAKSGPTKPKNGIVVTHTRMRWAQVPIISWALLFIAIAVGITTYIENPYGILFYTPRNWCVANRSHAFGIGFLVILTLCAALSGLLAIGGWIARAGTEPGKLKRFLCRAFFPSITSFLMLLSMAPVGIIVGELLPLKIDPVCHRGS